MENSIMNDVEHDSSTFNVKIWFEMWKFAFKYESLIFNM